MKPFSPATMLLYLLMSTTLKASFFWSAGNGLRLTGERESVLACAKTIDLLYNSMEAEKLINQIKLTTAVFNCPNGPDQSLEETLDSLIMVHDSINTEERDQIKQKILLQLEKHHIIETQFSTYEFITLHSTPDVQDILIRRLKLIDDYPLGRKLFQEMSSCNKKLIIVHDKSSINAGGYASAQRATMDIHQPGLGADARIRFRFDMPDHGTHLVTSVDNQMIPFTALDILFHELVHAKHIMCGTMSMGNSEKQAILEENKFRKERAETKDWPARDWRAYEDDQQIWFGY